MHDARGGAASLRLRNGAEGRIGCCTLSKRCRDGAASGGTAGCAQFTLLPSPPPRPSCRGAFGRTNPRDYCHPIIRTEGGGVCSRRFYLAVTLETTDVRRPRVRYYLIATSTTRSQTPIGIYNNTRVPLSNSSRILPANKPASAASALFAPECVTFHFE